MEGRLTGRVAKSLGGAARTTGKLLFRLGARLITACQLEPGNLLVGGIVHFMETSRTGRRLVLVPAFSEFISAQPAAPDFADDGAAHLSVEERAVLTVAAAAIAAKKPGRAVQVLYAHLAEHGARMHPLMFERLADVHLTAGQLNDAERVLAEGLYAYASNGRLHRSMADALSRKQEWQRARAHWEQVPDKLRASANVWTNISIVRAYRQTGSPSEADSIARRAAAVHPPNEQLNREIELCRPYHVDWSRALLSVDAPDRKDSQAVGIVESMGFLAGSAEPLAGRIDSWDGEAPTVTLRVNGLAVASTLAAKAPDTAVGRTFSINCADLLQYLGDGDLIQVLSDGEPVMLPGLGAAASVSCDLTSRIDELAAELAQGYVFTKIGCLRPGHTEASKRALLDFYEEVLRIITDDTGLPVFPFYGNLLGAIRQNDFIDHDVGGFDMVVICGGTDQAEVKDEVARICSLLLERGFHLQVVCWGVLIRRRDGDTTLLDLCYGWFNDVDELNVSFGWRFTPARGRENLTAHRVCRLIDREVRVPGNSEDVIEQLYGPQWRIPDQGFSVKFQLQRDQSYLFTESEIREVTSPDDF